MAPKITFPEIFEVMQVTGTLAHGITPSAIRIDFPKQGAPLRKTGDLKIEFEGNKVVWKDCLIDQTTSAHSTGGQVESLMLLDRRWKWAYQTTSFSFNERNEADEIREEPTSADLKKEGRKKVEISIIRRFFDTKRSARDIGIWLMREMGEKPVRCALPDDVYPEISGDEIRPAFALARLCDWFNCSVVLRTDDRMGVYSLGHGKSLPRGIPILQESAAVDLNARPEKVRVSTKPILYQWDMRLEAVGEEIDGNFLPIDELSYTPAAGWSSEASIVLGIYLKGETSDDVKKIKKIANRSIYRCYRPIYRGGSSAGLDDLMILDKERVVLYDQIAPMKDRQVATTFKQGARRPMPAIIYGQYFNPGSLNVNETNFEIPSPTEPLKSKWIVNESWAIDAQRGLVWFSGPMFRTDKTEDIEPADLFLRTAFYIKNDRTRVPIRYETTQNIAPPITPGVIQTRVVEELEPTVRYDFRKLVFSGGAEEAIIVDNRTDNFAKIIKEAKPYLAAMKEKIEDEAGPEAITYAGLIDSIELDGAIRSITWTVNLGGVRTRVQRNQDLGSSTTLSHTELRVIEMETDKNIINDRVPSKRLRSTEVDREVQGQ